jgi:hypothetical protein
MRISAWRSYFPFNVHPSQEKDYEGKVNVLIIRLGRWELEVYLSKKRKEVNHA